jgi:TolB-like protein/Tfp pilus assembly protein PilF
LRIGIHVGDIVYDSEGAYGDGVNVASRIEGLSVEGGVLISDKVYAEIQSHSDLKAYSLGYFELKNVKKPIELYSLLHDQLETPTAEMVRAKSGSFYRSIAVLPFVNMSPDPENIYFSDGITEEILNALTKVKGLHVTSRTSSFAFKDQNIDIREIGSKLNVSSVLEGSVRKFGNKVRITAQLINTSDGYHIWSEVYDRKLEDIFDIQDEISRKIANKLREKLARHDSRKKLVKSHTDNLEAYKLYLKGLYLFHTWNPSKVQDAIEIFDESIEMEPDFALPHAMLAACYIFLGSLGYMKPKEAYPTSKKYGLKALDLDDQIAEPHTSIAVVKMFYDWDFEGSERSFKRAIELNPSLATAHLMYTFLLRAQKRYDEAFEHTNLALLLDPLSPIINSTYANLLRVIGKFDDAIKQLERTLEISPTFRNALYDLGWTYYAKGDISKAIEILREAKDQISDPLKGVTQLGFVYGAAGMKKEALECIERIYERERVENSSLSMDLAVLYAGVRNFDKTFEYLNRAVEERSGGIIFITDPLWKEIHDDPRYNEILNKVKLKTVEND